MTNRLLQRGVEVDVLTIRMVPALMEGGAGPSTSYDQESLQLVDQGIRVYRSFPGVLDYIRTRFRRLFSAPMDLQGRFLFLRKLYSMFLKDFFYPASNMEWLFWGFLKGYRLSRKTQYDLIYSTDNPITCRLISYFLKKRFHWPWILFMGDPYCFGGIELLRPRWRLRIDGALDRKLLPSADMIIVNCQETRDGYLARFPSLKRERFCVITDGFDDVHYASIAAEGSENFRIVYTGTVYDGARNLDSFLEAISGLKGPRLEVVIAGNVGSSFSKTIEGLELKDTVKVLGFQSHNRIVSLQKGASVLLLVGWWGGFQIPGKLFEYFGAKRPILAIQNDKTDPTSVLVAKRRRGIVVDNDVGAIKTAIRELYSLWEENTLDTTFDLSDLQEFALGSLSASFVQLVEQVVQGKDAYEPRDMSPVRKTG